uniref:integrase core domain-containing protein n=1 Tax=Falsirhodobacter sp. 1013 TaxID=3417566 RepID=UPI003EBFEDD7
AEDTLYLFVGIDRTSEFAVTQPVDKAGKMAAARFLRDLIAAVPYRLHTVLTDNGVQFTNRSCDISAFEHIFDRVCRKQEIEHRLTDVKPPRTDGQVERMNRTIKDATLERFHSDDHNQLRIHLSAVMAAYNFARRLKTPGGLTPYEYICKIWTSEPDRFILNPIHQMPGLNT